MDERGAWEAGGENKGSLDCKKGQEKEKIFAVFAATRMCC